MAYVVCCSMLQHINVHVSKHEQTQFEVRKALVKLGKKYRRLDRTVKSGIVDMEKNFIYYLNCGSDADELKFYFEHHDKESRKLLSQWNNADTVFSKKLRGRMIVLAEISKVLNPEVQA